MNAPSPAEVISSLCCDVLEASAMLLYVLSSSAQYQPQIYVMPSVTRGLFLPGLSLCCLPCITGRTDDQLIGQQGVAVQMVYTGWVATVFACWENRFRSEVQTAIKADDSVRPQMEAFGDLRHIRNDLLHNKGVASMGHTGKCKVLRWFKSGDKMVFSTQHVFDFLNQIGAFSPQDHHSDTPPRSCSFSIPHGNAKSLLRWKPKPRLISVRTHEANVAESRLHKHVTLVFDNGLYVNVVFEATSGRRISDLGRAHFCDAGKTLMFDDGTRVPSECIYKQAARYHSDRSGEDVLYLPIRGASIKARSGRPDLIRLHGKKFPWLRIRLP